MTNGQFGPLRQKQRQTAKNEYSDQRQLIEQDTAALNVVQDQPRASASPAIRPYPGRQMSLPGIVPESSATTPVSVPGVSIPPVTTPASLPGIQFQRPLSSPGFVYASSPAPNPASVPGIPSSHAQFTPPPPVVSHDRVEKEGLIKRLIQAGLTRLQEPQPEGLLTRGLQAVRPGLGLAPLLAVGDACGILLVACSYYLSVWKYSYPLIEACFLAGLLLLFIPNLIRLLSREPTRLERMTLLCFLAACCYFIPFMTSTQHFSGFDEFLHWRTADDILRTHHLFSENSMLPVSPYYPGLEIVSNAVSSITGLSSFYAGVAVIAASRMLMMLALFLFFEYTTGSSRMAGIAIGIYMTNPHFIFFDTIYNYETLSLPLALFLLYILVRYSNTNKNYRWTLATAWLVLIAIVITHHMTSYVLAGLLTLWATVSFFRPVPRPTRIHLASIASFSILLVVAYAFLLPGNPVWSYLSEYFGGSFQQLEQIIVGGGHARHLFTSTVQAAPVWDELLMMGSVALVTFILPFGLIIVQRQHRDNALALTFAIGSLLYPFTQAFRFTSFGTEITDRAAAFLFLPIAYVLTVLITHFWPTRGLNRRAVALITGIITVIFLGGVIVGSGPDLIVAPGPYLVVADARSVEPEGIQDAIWSQTYLGPDNHVATDRINQMLMSTYGHQRIITRLGDNIDVSPIFYSATLNKFDIELLQEGQIHFLAVDTRISKALPLEGMYFENDMATHIISKKALEKFNTIKSVNRLFDSGDIVYYDVSTFLQSKGSSYVP